MPRIQSATIRPSFHVPPDERPVSNWAAIPAVRRRLMSTDPRARIAGLGLQLPGVSPPGGAYVPATRSGNLVFVSGQVPMKDGELIATGKVGAGVTTERASELSRQCALAALAAIDAIDSLDKVV